MFSQFKLASNEKVGCPLCREPWDLSSLREDCNGKSSKQQRCCASITCNNCLASQRGLFYRCYECSDASVRLNKSPIDFCSACFIRLPTTHTSHHFLSSSAACQSPDSVSWLGCPNPLVRNATIANAEFMNSLETRELTNNDYEMLLTLDTNRNSVDLALHLTKALLLQSELLRDGYKCSLCLTSSSSRLSCGHTVCENCLKDVIERALSEGLSSQVAKLTCPFNGCSSKLLPGLLRIRRKSVILPVEDLTPEGSTAARIPSSNQMSVAGSGLLTRTSLPPQGRSISASRLLPTLRTSRSFLAARPEGLTGAGNLFIIGSLRGTGSECLPVLSSQPQLQPLVLRRMPRGLLSIRSGRGDGIVRGYVRKERGSRAEDHGDLSSHLADEFVGSGLCLNVRNYSS